MRAIWKGTISFGLVSIPVALTVATKRSDPKFRLLDAQTLEPVQRRYVAPSEPSEEVETVKGYEVEPDSYVVVTAEELEGVRVERRRTIDIEAFVDVAEIDPVHYDRSYYVRPQTDAVRQYALLLEAMRRTGRAAVGRFVLSRREHLALIRAAGDALVLELLFYPEDVRPREEIEESVRGAEVLGRELDVAVALIENLSRPFEPEEFQNERNRELQALIERKTPAKTAPAQPAATDIPDLMAALEASLEQARKKRPKGGAKAKPRRAASRSG